MSLGNSRHQIRVASQRDSDSKAPHHAPDVAGQVRRQERSLHRILLKAASRDDDVTRSFILLHGDLPPGQGMPLTHNPDEAVAEEGLGPQLWTV